MINQLVVTSSYRLRQKLIHLNRKVAKIKCVNISGKLYAAVGTILEGYLLNAKVGDICQITDGDDKLFAEVVAIEGEEVKLLPYGSINQLSGNAHICKVADGFTMVCGDWLCGKIINGIGEVVGTLNSYEVVQPKDVGFSYSVMSVAPDPLKRPIITRQLLTGVKSIDLFISCGQGQRIAIFASPGMGKTTLMGMILRNTDADIVVIALIGERGREVQEFIELEIDKERYSRCILVVATSDRPPVEQVKAAYVAQTIAEYFRDQGKSVLLFADSVTRFARAQREVGLSSGEPIARGGFPPSVFMALPRLMERAGCSDKGSITAFYTVLMQGEDLHADPIAEEVKSIVDGHIILSRNLVEAGHFPAIDILSSLSRIADRLISNDNLIAARKIRLLLSKYNSLEFLLKVGEYQSGIDHLSDEAINKKDQIMQFLQQGIHEKIDYTDALQNLILLSR